MSVENGVEEMDISVTNDEEKLDFISLLLSGYQSTA